MSKLVPGIAQFSYLGTVTGPAQGGTLGTPSLGNGLALRKTGAADHKLYFVTNLLPNAPQVVECDVPSSFTGTLTNCHTVGSLTCQFKMPWGLHWDCFDQKLYQTCHNNYDGTPTTSKTLSRGSFVNGQLVSEGNWLFQSYNAKLTDGGVTEIPAWFQSTYSVPRLAVGYGMYRSLVATGPASMGIALAAFAPPTTGSTTAIPVTQLVGYPYSTHGPVNFPLSYQERMHRPTDYVNDIGADSGYPRIPGATGYTTWADWGYQCGTWIDTPNFSGLVCIVMRNTGRVWYTNTVNAAGWRYDLVVYSADDLGAVALGANPSSIQPSVDVPFVVSGCTLPTNGQHADSPPHDVTGVDFNPITRVFTFGVRFGVGTSASTYRTTYQMFRFLDTPNGCS
jgi:hypothetical protein